MSKIEQNRVMKKQAILTAAKSIFLSDGYSAANMDKVASHAKLTKQTLYRYFPSKVELFHATLEMIGQNYNERYSQHLTQENTRDALIAFATEFMTFHLSQEHIATMRLLIAEVNQAPEIVDSFMKMGADETNYDLKTFFIERFNLEKPNTKIELWIGMLLAPRSGALLGMPSLTEQQVNQRAIEATDILLSSVQ